jgi:D-beta-D-heptose 7-phosphate kinase/D-beta-D-heptose 1-phosphate adenosyltransferase
MTERAALAGLVERLSAVRVLCLGDLMLDRFVYGTVDRISPEGPIPVLRIGHEAAMLGGAGNVVRNVVALGGRASFASVVGDDAAGREVTGLIATIDAVEPYLVVARGRETTIKTRYIAGGQQLLRADRENLASLAPSVTADLRRVAVSEIGEAAATVLSDYGKGVLTDEVIAEVIGACRDAGRPVVVDPKGADFTRYGGASAITPNVRELAEASRTTIAGDAEVAAAAALIMAECGIAAVLVTRGAEGMTLVEGGLAPPLHLPAEAREVFDVSGAGDTVAATLATALGAGLALADAARLANAAAGIVVGKVGTAVASAGELFGALYAQELLLGERKVAGMLEGIGRVEEWRGRGLGVGFTNGVFDLLHPGHISLLSQAKATCDRLVVGLNSDASVSRIKGPGRPVQTEAARAAILSSLSAVDLVVIFAEDTPVRLIEALRPDVLVKGADYAVSEVVGADIVEGYGGKVLLADLLAGHSTTATIERLSK